MRGTPLYMAPEIYRGEKYDAAVDIYSLGIVLYKLLNNGRMPFMPPYPEKVRYQDSEEALEKRMSGAVLFDPINAKGELANIVLKACAFKETSRFSSPKDFKMVLSNYLSNATEAQKTNIVSNILDEAAEDIDDKKTNSNISAGTLQATEASRTIDVLLENPGEANLLKREMLGDIDNQTNNLNSSYKIEKLANMAILFNDYGVVPDLSIYNIDSKIILQLLNEVDFDMKSIVFSYHLIEEGGECYYRNENDFVWRFFDDCGVIKWLSEREYSRNISYICIYEDMNKKLSEIDIHITVDSDYEPTDIRNYEYELQLFIMDDWISSSKLFVSQSLNRKPTIKEVIELSRVRETKIQYYFDDCGNFLYHTC
jgi:serine/threonine protein kinase